MDSLNRPNFKENYFSDRILKYIIDIVVVVMLVILFITSMAYTATVKGSAMSPMINADNNIVINKLSYKILSPKRGDVVAFTLQGDEETVLARRVVALPGDSIVIKGGKLYINGEEQDLIENEDNIVTDGILKNELVLDKDEYFVIGDNWNSSTDSRYVEIGPISKKDIIGKVWFVISPISDFGFVN
ncbi:MAG: signal peptidase I [Lachnospiraceae bacterium]|nr:signal peptidase I [Lachnospiraceae bacterium]